MGSDFCWSNPQGISVAPPLGKNINTCISVTHFTPANFGDHLTVVRVSLSFNISSLVNRNLLKIPKPPSAQINRNSTHSENLILQVKLISQLNCEDQRQMALNLELKVTWNWPFSLDLDSNGYFTHSGIV